MSLLDYSTIIYTSVYILNKKGIEDQIPIAVANKKTGSTMKYVNKSVLAEDLYSEWQRMLKLRKTERDNILKANENNRYWARGDRASIERIEADIEYYSLKIDKASDLERPFSVDEFNAKLGEIRIGDIDMQCEACDQYVDEAVQLDVCCDSFSRNVYICLSCVKKIHEISKEKGVVVN